ncbi:MAG TPA: hypothetical protein PKZ32_00170 [Candidatus Melainabacteria bacterium]|nr:hypothetical protein [Candidatus Melainabacteria bacterium]
MPLSRQKSITLSPEKKTDKDKPDLAKFETESEKLRPGLERRLRAAKNEKSALDSKSVSCKDLIAAARSAKNKFTLAAIELFEYAHIAHSKSAEKAEKLANLIEIEIHSQLRHDDLVAYSGSGQFLVYFPETAKTESTMVLERLSRHICKRNEKRPIATQVSLGFKLLTLDSLQEGTEQDENRSFINWLSRYRLKSPELLKDDWVFLEAIDSWNEERPVCIKRIRPAQALVSERKAQLAEILSSIQNNGLALFADLFDFFVDLSSVYLVAPPPSKGVQNLHESAKTAHNAVISVCDLFLQLQAMTPPIVPLLIQEENLFAGDNENSLVYKTLDDHIVNVLADNIEIAEDIVWSKAISSFKNFLFSIAKFHASDECFSTASKMLEETKAKKNETGLLQKIRSTFKRHEEKLRKGAVSDQTEGKK